MLKSGQGLHIEDLQTISPSSSSHENIYSRRFTNSFSKKDLKDIQKTPNKIFFVEKKSVKKEKKISEPIFAMMVAPPK